MAGTGLHRRVAAVNRGAIRALALGQLVTALVVLALAFIVVQRGQEVDALRGELADTRARLVAAENDRDRLQARVDALEAALLLAGVDPDSIPPPAVAPSSTTGSSSSSSTPQDPAGRAQPTPRPTVPGRDSPASPGSPPPNNPENPPPDDDPDDEPPGPLPPETCQIPVLGPPLCS